MAKTSGEMGEVLLFGIDSQGRRSVLRAQVLQHWTPLESRDLGEGAPCELSRVEVTLNDPNGTWWTRYLYDTGALRLTGSKD